MDNKDAYIQHLENTIKSMQLQIDNLTEAVLLLRKEKFGPSSEKTDKSIDGQLSIFNEAEVCADESAQEPISKEVRGYTRKHPKTKREEIIKDLPVREVLCEAHPDDIFCHRCGGDLKPLGKETVREELEYIPAKLQIVRYVRMAYECPKCKKTDTPFIMKANTPTSLMNHSLASPSSVANVMYQKYVNSVPLYRQEKEWEQMGLSLSRATMANWIIRCSQDHFTPLFDYMHRQLLARDIVHCDETPVQVLKEEGRKPQSKSYMWLYRSGNDDRPEIILYDYQTSRSGDNAVNFLKGFKGFVHTDGYSGYSKLTDVTRCGCWAHLRRKFIEAIPSKSLTDKSTNAEIGRDYCDKLFEIERTLKTLSAKDRKEQRLKQAKPVLEAFWCWLENLEVLKGSALGKAKTYALNQRPYMENYLLDGRCSISNNAAENAIRPFTVGRKNWLFADTPKGADASAAIYSIIETAKAHGLNLYTYLEYLLMYMPDWDHTDEYLEDLMPWSETVQEECKR